jgi:hypothetical protein
MGQPVLVVEKPSRRPGIVRFEANRSLSGMGHETFVLGDRSAHSSADTPSAELARRLFATGRVAGVHVYQNMVTVDLEKGFEESSAPTVDAGGDPKLAEALKKVPAHLLERSRAARQRLKG